MAVFGVVLVLLVVMAVSCAEVLVVRYRSDRVRLYLLKAEAGADEQPLPPDAPGTPRRFDFWVAAIVTVAIGAGLGDWAWHSPR